MKTQEELNALKNEVITLNAKLAELNEDELKEVTGGSNPYLGETDIKLRPSQNGCNDIVLNPSQKSENDVTLDNLRSHNTIISRDTSEFG